MLDVRICCEQGLEGPKRVAVCTAPACAPARVPLVGYRIKTFDIIPRCAGALERLQFPSLPDCRWSTVLHAPVVTSVVSLLLLWIDYASGETEWLACVFSYTHSPVLWNELGWVHMLRLERHRGASPHSFQKGDWLLMATRYCHRDLNKPLVTEVNMQTELTCTSAQFRPQHIHPGWR